MRGLSTIGFPRGGQVGAHGVDHGQARDGGAEEADVTERAGRCQMAAEEGAAADAHVEDAGKNRHGDGGICPRAAADELGLHGDVEQCRYRAEQHAAGQHRGRKGRRRQEEEQADEQSDDTGAQHEKAVRAVEARKQHAAEEAAKAEHHERPGDRRGGKAGDRREERLDEAVGREVGRGEEERQDEDPGCQRVLEERGQLMEREGGLLRERREDAPEEEEGQECDDGKREERHAPAQCQADDAPERQAEDHGDGRARCNHREGEWLMHLCHEARGQRAGN